MKKFIVNAILDGNVVALSMPESTHTMIKELVARISADSETNRLVQSQAEAARRFRRSKMFYRRKR